MTYALPHAGFFSPKPQSPARIWLLIGVLALAVAGLFSLILVVARTPQLKEVPLFVRLFHEALVVHVNLSVLVWFLSIAVMFWSLLANETKRRAWFSIPYLERAAQLCFGGGAIVMALSLLDASGAALMSNYIPVISNRVFFLSLALLLCGLGFALFHFFLSRAIRSADRVEMALHFGITGSAIITAMAVLAFVWSYHLIPHIIEGQQYYEMLFWAGGHILQYTHAQMQMVCWLLLAGALIGQVPLAAKTLFALFAVFPLTALVSVYPLLAYDITSMEFHSFYTQMMIVVNGLPPAILGILLMAKWGKIRLVSNGQRALSSCFIMSFLLFAFGGIFGAMIRGQNVVIPAHYHGSIVSATLAFMGVAYLLLPKFGYRNVSNWKLAFWQPIVYGAGQIMHISGLAWSGGYGVLRKTPGMAENSLTPAVKAAMGLMGGGGAIAIIGGLMFVIVVAKAVWSSDKAEHGA